ncbi:hypothetical protein DDB_G0280789 [Dictyostelium discoideum AX4]|uniref:Uncharacterized protein n=1 Tax=Dictyostelium discoideum TaxID=44689 RepID=Q54UV6_DICDI|nr:hypothetical protein DDB_G0280789 [Dictyostelium discoideum AX4]EAL67052.1 hypothetical protein DDB_G0280789 [Dictyostelium discoideum AX4]|eukprot:XP_641031.1 hypothetical protein DDB_G0280789 [Dictyostelium discoideum AX4]
MQLQQQQLNNQRLKIIGDYCRLVDKKEILDFYFQNYRDECLLFNDQNQNWKNIQLGLIKHYEYLMGSIGKRCELAFLLFSLFNTTTNTISNFI